MLKSVGRSVLWGVMLLSAYSFAKFQGGYSAWFLFYATGIIALYAFLTYRFAGKRMTSVRKVSSTKLTAGASLDVNLQIRSSGQWPLAWLVVEEQIPHRWTLQGASGRRMFFPGFERKIRMQYTIPNLQRGKYSIQHTVLRTGDIFGFVRKEFVHSRQDVITVYPRTVQIRYWHTVNQFNTGASFAQNRMAEDTNNVLGVREYAPGDRLSRIHWRATARTGSIKSKEFELHVTNELMFFLNRSQYDYEAGMGAIFETAVTTAASLIRYALERKYSAGLVSYGKERMVLPVSRNQEQYVKILEHLALVQPDSNQSFKDTVLKEINYLPRGSTAVLITPVINEEIVRLVSFLEHRKMKAELFLIKPPTAVSETERQWIGKMAVFGVHVYVVGSDQELEETVKGEATYVAAN